MIATPRLLIVSLALPLLAAAPALAQTCSPYWRDVGNGLPFYPFTMAAVNDGLGGILFAGGQAPGDRIYRWDGRVWTDISATLPGITSLRFSEIHVFDEGFGPTLFAIGNTQDGMGHITYFGRRWNGSSWVEPSSAFVPAIYSAWPYASADLGDGAHIYGLLGNPNQGQRIGRWNGTAWEPISDIFGQTSFNLIVLNQGNGPRLYAIGGFLPIGSSTMPAYFARWTIGTTWEIPPSNLVSMNTIYDVAAYDDGHGPAIYAYGYIYANGSSQEFPGVGRWDGQTWVNIGGDTSCPGCIETRRKIEVFDDGSGPALYVTGSISQWGGVQTHGIVRWNGTNWSAVGAGIHPGSEVNGMVVGPGPSGPTLYIGGLLDMAGGGTINHVAALVGCPNCYANCDLSTQPPRLSVLDFACFLDKFAANDPYANCDQSTTPPAINILDFICFLNKFAAGCP